MGVGISLVSGIVAAFTPCVIVLFPLVLYRFFSEDKKEIKPYLTFIAGFLIAYILFGYLISQLLTSFIQNGFKVGIGLMFIVLGILAVMGKLNPLHFPLVKNSFVLGILFALALSFNPCSLPYLGAIISLGSQGTVVINMLFYAFGLLMPSILFAFIGQKMLTLTKGSLFNTVNKIMSIILIIAGFYLLTTIRGFAFYDLYIVLSFMVLIIIVLLKSFFIINSKKDLLKPKNLLLFAALLLIIAAIVFNCHSVIVKENEENVPLPFNIKLHQMFYEQESCGEHNILECNICMRCLSLFLGATVLFFVAITINRVFPLQKKKIKKTK